MSVRWGVIGPGGIAARFADAMAQCDGGEIVAVSSRSIDRAHAYADRFGVGRRYDDVDALAADGEVDAVYVATPHSQHEADTVRMAEAGKHVLCEKSFALTALQARRMVDAVQAAGVFCMEAVWSRFLPAYRTMTALITDGRIGEPLLVEADFGFRTPVDPAGRHFDLALGGGAMLDLGVYPVQLCHLILGAPTSVIAGGSMGVTGVDESIVAVLGYADDRLGVAKAALRVPMSCTGRISGTEGHIDIPAFVHCPDHLVVGGSRPERIDCSWVGEGMRFEIDEVHRCLAAGLPESPVMSLAETVSIAETMDAALTQLGVVYDA